MAELGNAFPGKEQMQSFSSFSGADIVATFGGHAFGELQAITYSIQREIGPIYTMGSPDPRAYAKGKRGIAGTIVWTTFDRHALLGTLINAMQAHGFENFDIFTAAANLRTTNEAGIIEPLPGMQEWNNEMGGNTTVDQLYQAMAAQNLMYIDQVPPFDITITMANEYGLSTNMAIRGVQLWSENSGMTIDDLVIEQNCGFIAQTVEPLGHRAGKLGPKQKANFPPAAPGVGDDKRYFA